jgi:hypothetical protein
MIIYLITPDQLQELPIGTVLYNIFGEKHTKGFDRIDDDTRFGYLAYGFLEDEYPDYLVKEPRAKWEVLKYES